MRRHHILHRYFNENEAGVAYNARLNVLQLIKDRAK